MWRNVDRFCVAFYFTFPNTCVSKKYWFLNRKKKHFIFQTESVDCRLFSKYFSSFYKSIGMNVSSVTYVTLYSQVQHSFYDCFKVHSPRKELVASIRTQSNRFCINAKHSLLLCFGRENEYSTKSRESVLRV